MTKDNNNFELKPVPIRDQKALQLVHQRAQKEHRSLANAATVTIIETLSEADNNAGDEKGQA